MDLSFARANPTDGAPSAAIIRTGVGHGYRGLVEMLAVAQRTSRTARIAARLGAGAADAQADGMLAGADGRCGWLGSAGATDGSFHPRTAQTLRQMS
jgi:hypothetical protein